jgi:hypothetical protein
MQIGIFHGQARADERSVCCSRIKQFSFPMLPSTPKFAGVEVLSKWRRDLFERIHFEVNDFAVREQIYESE